MKCKKEIIVCDHDINYLLSWQKIHYIVIYVVSGKRNKLYWNMRFWSYCTLVEDNFQMFLPASTPELCAVTKMDHGFVKQANWNNGVPSVAHKRLVWTYLTQQHLQTSFFSIKLHGQIFYAVQKSIAFLFFSAIRY